MRKWTSFLLLFSFVLLFLGGCNSAKPAPAQDDLFRYKDSYVGDNGAVGNITNGLPSPYGEKPNGLELKTFEEPYGIILNYMTAEATGSGVKNYEETALFNATFILALVKNADWVHFNFVEEEMIVTREDLENWYGGKDLREFETEEELTKFSQEFLEDEDRVIQFFD